MRKILTFQLSSKLCDRTAVFDDKLMISMQAWATIWMELFMKRLIKVQELELIDAGSPGCFDTFAKGMYDDPNMLYLL